MSGHLRVLFEVFHTEFRIVTGWVRIPPQTESELLKFQVFDEMPQLEVVDGENGISQ
eukprot:COSAG02_NODE_3729_length_6314_cov_74.389220_2_plen_57_part_00